MKIVLLPGMDGTGLLFKDFIRASPLDCLVLSLPESGEQSHKALSEIMVNNLPTDAYALVAESFSGGLVPYLIQSAKVKPQAIILVASFLHSPRPLLAKCVYYLPWKILLKILSITGPHFLMQANPDECATEIVTFMKELEESRYSVCQSD